MRDVPPALVPRPRNNDALGGVVASSDVLGAAPCCTVGDVPGTAAGERRVAGGGSIGPGGETPNGTGPWGLCIAPPPPMPGESEAFGPRSGESSGEASEETFESRGVDLPEPEQPLHTAMDRTSLDHKEARQRHGRGAAEARQRHGRGAAEARQQRGKGAATQQEASRVSRPASHARASHGV